MADYMDKKYRRSNNKEYVYGQKILYMADYILVQLNKLVGAFKRSTRLSQSHKLPEPSFVRFNPEPTQIRLILYSPAFKCSSEPSLIL